MLRDAPLRFQNLLAELEDLDEERAVEVDIRTRRSEILQSILQLFSANAERAQSEPGPPLDVRH